MRRADRRGHRRHPAGAGRAHQRARSRPRVPGRGRIVQRAGRDRCQAGPGPGPGRRHRQDPAGPALERLLRQGTGRPLLPVLRPGPLRRPVRARGHRLPGRLRPLDRAAQHRVLPRPPRAQGHRGRDLWSPASSRWSRRRRLRGPGLGACRRRRAARVPGARAETARRARRAGLVPASRHAAPRGTSARQLAVGFIGAGNYASSMLLPHLARMARRPPGARRHHPVAVGGQRQRRFGFATASTNADAVLATSRWTRSSS